MEFTKRNHYNPCFWTAYWNQDYYKQSLSNSVDKVRAREQIVYALNVKSDKIYRTTVENVHFDKYLGVAEITLETAKEFCKRHHPDKYEEFCQESTEDQYPVYIDFEEILTAIENMPSYQILLKVIKHQSIATVQEKVFLASFVFLQLLRSHAIMNSMLEMNSELGQEKFEYFIQLKWMLSDADLLFKAVAPLVFSQWTLYRTARDTFPLTDSAVLVNPNSIMTALSPRLMLEISSSMNARENEWHIKRSIKRSKMREFRRRTIGNTFREIIFSDEKVLRRWQNSSDFRQRVKTVEEMGSYNLIVTRLGERDLWHINAFGNQQV
ncbi:MAG: DUF4238 domain-containing protein [Anaerolineae bacterium]|nr:DUF4238 domain-containing protein [Anaerolineae bacterium]